MDFQAYIIDASVIISIFHYKLDKNKKQDDIYNVDSFQDSVYYSFTKAQGNERNGICNFTPRTDGKRKTTLAKRLERCGFSVIYENPYPIVEKRKAIKVGYEFKRRVYSKSKSL